MINSSVNASAMQLMVEALKKRVIIVWKYYIYS